MHQYRHAIILFVLSFVFAVRVAGQAVQRWFPQSFLPPFDAFQGSNLPYWLLLSIQICLLAMMFMMSWRIGRHTLLRRGRTGRLLAWTGGIYMFGSILRILIGIAFPDAGVWFKAWIPAFFHLVLAGFILVIALYHLHPSEK